MVKSLNYIRIYIYFFILIKYSSIYKYKNIKYNTFFKYYANTKLNYLRIKYIFSCICKYNINRFSNTINKLRFNADVIPKKLQVQIWALFKRLWFFFLIETQTAYALWLNCAIHKQLEQMRVIKTPSLSNSCECCRPVDLNIHTDALVFVIY